MSQRDDGESRIATRTSIVYSMLRRDIVSGLFAPGERLRIENLVERYQVGATPLREALNRLSSEGLVSQQDQRGFRVSPISRADLLELTRTREWVNEIIVREAIRHGDEAWEESIVLAFHRMTRTLRVLDSTKPGLNPAWEAHHRAFHNALIAACPSRSMLDFSARLFDAADRYRNLVTVSSHVDRDVEQEHLEIKEAVLGRHTARAVELLNLHTRRTTDQLLEILAEAGQQDAGRSAELASSAPA